MQPASLLENSAAEQVIIYSHGFAVKYDARGMFTAIAKHLPGAVHVMFDYNNVNERTNTITVAPVSEQVELFRRKLAEVKRLYPNAKITIVAHSFGCMVAGLAGVEGVAKAVLITPPLDLKASGKRLTRLAWKRLRPTLRGETILKRRDGTKVIIPKAYRQARKQLGAPADIYNRMAQVTQVNIITASDDQLLGELDTTQLSPQVTVQQLKGTHNFTREAREPFAQAIAAIISES